MISDEQGSWEPSSPDAWARVLGMTLVPLFGQCSPSHVPGEHAVLFDGLGASFIISVADSADINLEQEPLSWAWSANVQHVLMIDRTRGEMFLRRWDSDQIRRFRLPKRGQGARELLALIENAPGPRAPDIVLHLMRRFRSITSISKQPIEAIHILNGLLAAAGAVRRGKISESQWRSFRLVGDVFAVANYACTPFCTTEAAMESLLNMKLGELPQIFLAPEILTGCQFEPSLLLRHAASRFYAHVQAQLANQTKVVGVQSSADETTTRGSHETPSNFVRMLTQEALRVYFERWPESNKIDIIDPACGTGAYLAAALRETSAAGFSGKITLRGIDGSAVAKAIADFWLHWTASDFATNGLCVELDIRMCNALEVDWGPSDIVLMTPPFMAMQRIGAKDLALVESSIGNKVRFADLAGAFLWKAAESIADECVIATQVPAHLLGGQSTAQLRKQLAGLLDLRLVGRFDRTRWLLPMAFAVLQRRPRSHSGERPAVQVVLAKDGAEDAAMRALRLDRHGLPSNLEQGVEVFRVPQDYISPDTWSPRTSKSFRLLEFLRSAGLPTVDSLFNIMIAGQTGHDEAFVLSADDLAQLPPKEQAFFRPVARGRSLQSGRLVRSEYVFYPYDSNGLRFHEETDLSTAVPKFWETRLEKFESALKESRYKRKPWWGFLRERAWQRARIPKLVCSEFVGPGKFAYDDAGDYVLLRGYGWIWKQQVGTEQDTGSENRPPSFHEGSLPWAYLALLNSSVFEQVLSCFVGSLQGIFRATASDLNKVFLPDLSDEQYILSESVQAMACFGRMIHAGKIDDVDQAELTRVCSIAYGLPLSF